MQFCICWGHAAKQDFRPHIYTVIISSGYIRNNCVAKRLCKEQTLLSTFSCLLTLITFTIFAFSCRNKSTEEHVMGFFSFSQQRAGCPSATLWLNSLCTVTLKSLNYMVSKLINFLRVNMWRYTTAITASLHEMSPCSCKYKVHVGSTA